MQELINLWNSTPNCVKAPILVILCWIIIVKVIVGITRSGSDLTEDETNRAFTLFLGPIMIVFLLLGIAQKKVDQAAKNAGLPVEVKDDDEYIF